MTLHVARWEWRTFGPEAGSAEARIRAAAFETGSLNETYFLAPSDRVVARLRNGQLEARWLVEPGDSGLELWRTEIKTGLPIPAQRVADEADPRPGPRRHRPHHHPRGRSGDHGLYAPVALRLERRPAAVTSIFAPVSWGTLPSASMSVTTTKASPARSSETICS